MRIVSFDTTRAARIPGARFLKQEHLFAQREALQSADWVLFPHGWQVNALVYGMGCRIFPSVASYSIGRDKVEMTRALLAVAPQHVPETLILPATAEAAERAIAEMGFPMIAKLPRSARGEHVALITGRQQLMQWLATCEVLYLQEYLPCERDLRVVWVGDRVVTAYWRVGGDGLHHNLARGAVVDATGVPAAALELVARVASHLGIDHAGFDLLEIGGHCYILELNVLFGFEGINQLGVDLAPVIVDYLRRRLQDDDQPPRPGPAALPLAG